MDVILRYSEYAEVNITPGQKLNFFVHQGGEMLYAWYVGLAKNVAYPLKPPFFSSNKVTSRKSKKLWTKGPEWNNAAYEEKEKNHHFTRPARDYTNSHPHINKKERMRTWETEETNTRSKTKETKIKAGGKSKESRLLKSNYINLIK